MPGAISCCAAVVDNSAQRLKERRSAVNLVDDDELANLGAQKCVRILEAPLISWTLKVKVYRPCLPHGRDLASQCGFADLARAEENDSRHLSQALFDDGAESSRDHCYTGILTTDVNIPVLKCQAANPGCARGSGANRCMRPILLHQWWLGLPGHVWDRCYKARSGPPLPMLYNNNT